MPDEPVERHVFLRLFLRLFLQEHAVQLQAILRAYVLRGGVASGEAVQTIALEIFQDAVFEALAHADRLDPGTQPRAWFLSIAINMLRRRKARQARGIKREVLLSDLYRGSEPANESAIFEQVARVFAPGPEQEVEEREQEQEILALVSASGARVLRLAVVDGLSTEGLAKELGVQPGAAQQRKL